MAVFNSRLERLSLLILLLFAAALDTVGIGFYLPRHYDPSIDSIHPAIALDAVEHAFGERDLAGIKYPRLHPLATGLLDRAYLVLRHGPSEGSRIAHEIVECLRSHDASAPRSTVVAPRDRFSRWKSDLSASILVGRAFSAAMGVLLVFAMFLLAREITGRLEAFLAAFLTAVAYPVVYYAHTLNVDVMYLALGALALAFAFAAANRRCGRRLALASMMAALAIATKDQAYGWFLLTIPFVLLRWTSWSPRPNAPFPIRAVVFSLVAGGVTYALAIGIPFDTAGVKAHLDHIFGAGSEAYQLYPKSWVGQVELAHEVGLHVLDAMGAPLLLFAIAGLVAMARKNKVALGAILVPALSYHLSFLAPIRYCYQRFTLPITLLLFIAAAIGLSLLLRHRALRLPGLLIAFVLLGERAQRAIEVDAMLLDDPQGRAAAYLETALPEGASVIAALQFPLSNVEIPARVVAKYSAPSALPTLEPGDDLPRFIVFAHYDPMVTAFDPHPLPAGLPPSMRQYVSNYDRIAMFAPLYEHSIRRGAAFLPTIGLYELSKDR